MSGKGWPLPEGVMAYGMGPVPSIPDPWDPRTLRPNDGPITVYTPPIVVRPRPEVCAGLAKLLPTLQEALEKGGRKLDADEVAAMVWLEGVAAGAASKEPK